MAIAPGRLAKLWQAAARKHQGDRDQALWAYEDELQALLGVSTDEHGYRRIVAPQIRPKQVSIRDVGEAFIGRQAMRDLYVRIQEGKMIRYGATSAPADDILPTQEFPSGDLGADWVRANRMKKQAMALAVSWEAAHFDQTDSLIDAADAIADRFALTISERVEKAIWGVDNTYNYKGTITDTYRTTGSYINKITNELVNTLSLDAAEQQLLAQTDPVTGLEIDTPAMNRVLISTIANRFLATRLAVAQTVNTGALDDPERMDAPAFYQTFQVFNSQRSVRLMVAGLGITSTQAGKRWVWGDTKGAFQYRSAKDITTYRYTLEDTAALARRDVLMELDCSEMGSVTVKEPRRVVLNIKDS
jgi:hypothetical protein